MFFRIIKCVLINLFIFEWAPMLTLMFIIKSVSSMFLKENLAFHPFVTHTKSNTIIQVKIGS